MHTPMQIQSLPMSLTFNENPLKPMTLGLEGNDPIESIFERGHKRKKYENFSDSQLETLNDWFSKSIYPKIEDFDNIAHQIQQPRKKIQNWFKYKRRLAVLENENKIPQYKTKKVLSPNVFELLKEYFKINQNPTLKEFRDLAKKINLKEKQIISWFTYRRRKLKLTRQQKHEENDNSGIKGKDGVLNHNRTFLNQTPLPGELLAKRIQLDMFEKRMLQRFGMANEGNFGHLMTNSLESGFNDFPVKKEFTPCQNIVSMKNSNNWLNTMEPMMSGASQSNMLQAMQNNMNNMMPLQLKLQNMQNLQNIQNLQNLQNFQNFQNLQNTQNAIMRNFGNLGMANRQVLNKMSSNFAGMPYFAKDSGLNLKASFQQSPNPNFNWAAQAMNNDMNCKSNHFMSKLEVKQENP